MGRPSLFRMGREVAYLASLNLPPNYKQKVVI
jgi:hypothetical protein